MTSTSKEPARIAGMFDAIARRYDLVNRVMTFGLDVAWRRRSVAAMRLAPGSRVLDLACGTGDFCNELSRQGLVPVGLDFSFGMLASATTAAPLAIGSPTRTTFGDGPPEEGPYGEAAFSDGTIVVPGFYQLKATSGAATPAYSTKIGRAHV